MCPITAGSVKIYLQKLLSVCDSGVIFTFCGTGGFALSPPHFACPAKATVSVIIFKVKILTLILNSISHLFNIVNNYQGL